MGNLKSKHKLPGRNKDASSSNLDKGVRGVDPSGDDDDWNVIRQRWVDDPQLKTIRRTIDRKPDMFVLNNLMMCVQFFENFDEEMRSMRQSLVSSRETELNSCLPAHKHTLVPDILQQHVAEKIDFTCKLPSLKHTIELIQPIRIYVIFDNIEVTEENYASPYSSVNQTVTYSMQLKPSQEHKGYVHLQRLEVNPPKKVASVDDLSRLGRPSNAIRDNYSDGDSVYEGKSVTRLGVVGSRVKNVRNSKSSSEKSEQGGIRSLCGPETKDSPSGSTSSGYRSANLDTESDYGYAPTTYNEETPKLSQSSLEVSSSEIPRECFKRMEFRADGRIYDARRERKQKMSVTEQLVWQAHRSKNYSVWYLNSKKFMKFFCEVFSGELAIPMGFDPDTRTGVHGSVIYRDKVEVLEGTMSTKLETFEIVPCVSCQWPDCAREWLDRPRTSWPNYAIVDKVREFGCHVVPEVSIGEKSGAYQDLEWQLVFPAAERYLEACLTYPQVRVYLTTLMLHKSFIRPVDSIFGLTTAHIKNRLFWLVEEDDGPATWAENRTGEALVRFLDSLYRSISQDEPTLPDYFVREKNLFREKACLLRTQKQLKRIIENPVMYVFHALESVRHGRKFFPRLDYEQLLKILTADVIALVNPAIIARNVHRPLSGSSSSDRDYDHAQNLWDIAKRKTDDKPKALPRKPLASGNLINLRRACDEVVEIPIRCASLEPRRLSSLLDFFAKHFIKMAEYCHRYGASPQKTTYIEQSERLSILLLEDPLYRDEARYYLKQISFLRSQNADSKLASSPPETPRRNPDMPLFARPLKDRYKILEHDEDAEKNVVPNGSVPTTTKVLIHEENVKFRDKGSIRVGDKNSTSETSRTKIKLLDPPSEEIENLRDEPEATYI